jgi:hypothetical protein
LRNAITGSPAAMPAPFDVGSIFGGATSRRPEARQRLPNKQVSRIRNHLGSHFVAQGGETAPLRNHRARFQTSPSMMKMRMRMKTQSQTVAGDGATRAHDCGTLLCRMAFTASAKASPCPAATLPVAADTNLPVRATDSVGRIPVRLLPVGRFRGPGAWRLLSTLNAQPLHS